MKFFPPEFRTASVVPRWSIIWTLTRDTLSNHSFFVTLYANQIARMIGWQGPRDMLMFRALTHDLDETITGDVVAPVKKEIIDTERAQTYILGQMQERMPTIIEQMTEYMNFGSNYKMVGGDGLWIQCGKIVKAADRLDALLFLTVEQRMGNGVVAPRIPEVKAGLRAAWFLLPAEPRVLSRLWDDLEQEIRDHATSGGFGI